MELKHLNTFLALSRIKHFTKTAKYLNYAQSNVTTQIKQLEQELNVKLFERIGKSVSLTLEGEKLIPYASKMISLASDVSEIYSSSQNSGRIVIGAFESLSIYKLPAIIKKYKNTHPDVELFLMILDSSNFIPLLANNTIDIAFVLEEPIHDKAITIIFQKREPIGLFSTQSHPFAEKAIISAKDLSDEPIILTGKGCCYRGMFEKDLFAASVRPKVVLETGSIQVIKETGLSGLGLCVLPEFTVQKELNNHELVKLAYDCDFDIYSQLIYHSDKWISPNLQEFISISEECY